MLRVHVLGGLRVSGAAGAAAPRGRPAQALLAWLALHPGPHARGDVAARLWPDTLDRAARTNLRSALLDLRRSLGAEAVGILRAEGDRLELVAWVDRREVAAAIEGGRYEQALELAAGELLPGFDDEWVLGPREAHRADVVEALEGLAAAAERAGDHATAVARNRAQADLDPLDEEVARRLMRRLTGAGNRAAALEVYDRLSDRLRRGFGVAPSRTTRELARELRDADAAERAAHVEQAESPLPPILGSVARSRPPLIGRGTEIEALRAAWREARDGGPRAVVILGEPGIGKTRLAAALAAEVHDAGAHVLFGRCDADGLVPYAPFAEAVEGLALAWPPDALRALAGPLLQDLARLAPAVGRHLGVEPPRTDGEAGEDRVHLLDGIAGFLAALARTRPTLLLMDDAHWLDPHSAQLLRRLMRSAHAMPLLVVLTARDTEGGSAPTDVEHRSVRLAGLRAHDTRELVGSLSGQEPAADVVERIHRATSGNPLYAGELVRHLAESRRLGDPEPSVPPTLLETIGARVGRLAPEVQEALLAAAVAGERFDLRVLARALGRSAREMVDALDAATVAGVVSELPGDPAGRFAFVHGLLRQALYERLTAARRALLHDAMAEALGAAGEGNLPERADHALRGLLEDSGTRAVDLALAAAEQHLRVFAYDEAAALLERVVELAADLGPERGVEVRLALGGALQRAGRPLDAAGHLQEALTVARRSGDGAAASRVVLALGGLGTSLVEPDQELIGELDAAVARATDDEQRSLLMGRLATELSYTGEVERREALSAEAVALARRTGGPGALVSALTARRVALWSPDRLAERMRLSEEAVAVAAANGLSELELEARNWRYVDLVEAGRMDGARTELDAYEALARERRLPRFHWYAVLWRASLALAAGELAESRRLAELSLEEGRAAGDPNAGIFDRLIYGEQIDRGRLDLIPLELQLQRVQERAGTPAAGSWLAGMAVLLAGHGRDEEARDLLDELARDGYGRVPRDTNRLACLCTAAWAAARLGLEEHAASLLPLLEPYADHVAAQGRAVHILGSCSTFIGRLQHAAGDLGAAEASLRQGLEVEEAAGLRTRAAHGRLALAELLADRGRPADRREARHLVGHLEQECAEMGLDGLLAQAEAVAERL